MDQVASQDDVAKIISKRPNVIQRGAEEAGNADVASVRHLVGLVLHAADSDDRGNFELLPQRAIRHAIAGHSYESMPGFILRGEVDTIELITHESKARGCTDKAWAQISGEIDRVWTTATRRSANKSCTCWLLSPLISATGMQLQLSGRWSCWL